MDKTKLLNERYEKVKRLGEGSYGTVYLAIDRKPKVAKRRVDPAALQQLDKVGDAIMQDNTEQQTALQVLSDNKTLFKDNNANANEEQTA